MENVVVDSESYSDFEPSQAPLWSIQVKMAEQPACLLSEYFTEFIHLCSSNRSLKDLLGELVDRGTSGKKSILYFSRKVCLYGTFMFIAIFTSLALVPGLNQINPVCTFLPYFLRYILI
jgi:hypothetical protein